MHASCPTCSQMFPNKTLLNIHQEKCGKHKKKIRVCHLEPKLGDRPLKAAKVVGQTKKFPKRDKDKTSIKKSSPRCNKVGFSKFTLDYREMRKGLRFKERGHKCDPCQRYFGTAYTLKKHNVNQHGLKPLPSLSESERKLGLDLDSICCPECDKVFDNKIELVEHFNFYHGKNKHCFNCG